MILMTSFAIGGGVAFNNQRNESGAIGTNAGHA